MNNNNVLYDMASLDNKAHLFKTLKGSEFVNYYGDKFYKITNEDEEHYNYKYRDGLNEDINTFNPNGENELGGLYFTNIDNIFDYMNYGINVREVIIPNDASVYVENKSFKANKIILGKKMCIDDFVKEKKCM